MSLEGMELRHNLFEERGKGGAPHCATISLSEYSSINSVAMIIEDLSGKKSAP